MNSAEDVSDSMSCWDAWKEKVNKKHDADKDAFTVDMDKMSCMDAWTHVCQSQWPLNSPTLRRGTSRFSVKLS